ncbi:MAG: diaminopimelate decarboxylase [Candidatus Eremiobacteraeota bacterium]|nr:diaminopimelate decarboxylase [Candidatus Eremiobacteraeota bacterium]
MHRQPVGSINDSGHLVIGGCDTVELAKQFGTPLIVLDEAVIRESCRLYREAFRKHYPQGQVVYAGKAFLCTAMCRLVEQEGLFLDVVSGGELYTAMKAEFSPEKIFFHGNNKTQEELEAAIQYGVGRIVVDNPYELRLLEPLTKKKKKPIIIHFRVTPGVETHTHHSIQTGQSDSKFGFSLLDDTLFKEIRNVIRFPRLKLTGLHCHIGSQIFDQKAYQKSIEVMLRLIKNIKVKTGAVVQELNFGGGLGVRYTQDDAPPSIEEHIEIVTKTVRRESTALGLPMPILYDEPGRSIVARAGVTLYTIGSIKEIPKIRKYVSVDGGMSDNPRVALYDAKYESVLANRFKESQTEKVTIAGKCCESGDILQKDVMLPKVKSGDILALFSTGAYHYAMASNYNRLPRPAVVLCKEGKAEVIIRRETYDDLIARDVVPDHLNHKVRIRSR